MKIAGAVMIIISSGFLGLNFYKKCKLKLIYTQGLIAGFEYIKNEISFTQVILSKAFIDASEFSGTSRDFFLQFGKCISSDGVTMAEAFEKNKHLLKLNTCKEVYGVSHDAILQLGTTDSESQMNLINSTIEKLKASHETQKNFCEKEGIMCKKIGFVLGVAISIFLF